MDADPHCKYVYCGIQKKKMTATSEAYEKMPENTRSVTSQASANLREMLSPTWLGIIWHPFEWGCYAAHHQLAAKFMHGMYHIVLPKLVYPLYLHL